MAFTEHDECHRGDCRRMRQAFGDLIKALGFGDPLRRIEELRGNASPEARCDACAASRAKERERVKVVANDINLPKAVREAARAWLDDPQEHG
jgi:hypothetical protein